MTASRARELAVFVPALLLCAWRAEAAAASHVYVSPAGFTATYAPPWRRRSGAHEDELLLLSPGREVKGPVIGDGQAALHVKILGPATSRASLEALLRQDATPADPPPSPLTPQALRSHCDLLLRAETRDDSGPGPVERDTFFYCVAEKRAAVVILSRYEGDPKDAAYLVAALRLVGGLQVRPEPAAPLTTPRSSSPPGG